MGIIKTFVQKSLFGVQPAAPKNLSRNAPCWCESGKKYKHCHWESDKKREAAEAARKCRTG